ncbi:MAG: type II secretion system protein GspG [Planctomycetota bacterium]|jgi:type II secretory pathway pseudopilin PulG|nr:type II secretion system protein GspG [Planctomycetota bacterium]
MKRHFTLVELLIVVAVIVVIAGLVMSSVGYLRKVARRNQALDDIHSFYNALEKFKFKYGVYPQESDASVLSPTVHISKKLVDQLDKEGDFAHQSKVEADGLLDPWGKLYQVIIPTSNSQEGFSGAIVGADTLTKAKYQPSGVYVYSTGGDATKATEWVYERQSE